MWLPATATTASSLCRNDSGSSDPQYRDFRGREPVAGNHKIMFWRSCGLQCQFLWTKCADRFSCAATQFLVINAAPASHTMRKAKSIARWMTQSSSLSFWRPPRQTFTSATSICLVTEIIMSTTRYKNINSPPTSLCMSSCTWPKK